MISAHVTAALRCFVNGEQCEHPIFLNVTSLNGRHIALRIYFICFVLSLFFQYVEQ